MVAITTPTPRGDDVASRDTADTRDAPSVQDEVAALLEVLPVLYDALDQAAARVQRLLTWCVRLEVPRARLARRRYHSVLAADVPTGMALQSRRVALSLSQRQVAFAACLSRGLLADTESGRRSSVETRAHLDRVLAALEAGSRQP